MTHKTCLTCQHGEIRNQAGECEPPVMRNWCQKHRIWWQELCSDWLEADDLIDIPGRGDGPNYA